VFDDAFAMHGGYVLNFSDRTFSEFFDDEFGINIYDEKYRFNGSSKAKHMRAFIATEDRKGRSPMHRKRPRRLLVDDLNDPACSRINQNRMYAQAGWAIAVITLTKVKARYRYR
jgi:hypothetical protein